jgi:arsenate reductase
MSNRFVTGVVSVRFIARTRLRRRRMHLELEQYIKGALLQISEIPEGRKRALDDVAAFVSSKIHAGEDALLNFICTHNSRRSQMAQLWAAASAAQFGIEGVRTYSGGTETTAFDHRAVAALERAGFVVQNPGGVNPRYRVSYDPDRPAIECFSKPYDDPANPTVGFAAIVTCAEADQACPVVTGAALRAPIRYEDPKAADGTEQEAAAYDARCLQIATEMLYLFSRVA